MLGIDDPYIWSAYLLSILSALLCVVYGAVNWNRGDDAVEEADQRWVKHEKQIEDELDV